MAGAAPRRAPLGLTAADVRVAVVGTGAVGIRAARHALSLDSVTEVLVVSRRPERAAEVASSLGPGARQAALDELGPSTVAILAGAGPHAATAARLVSGGCGVVSTSGRLDDVEALLALDAEASERGVPVVPGAAMAPGLACLLAVHAVAGLDRITDVRVARAGSGGKACAAERAHAVRGVGWRWSGGWERAPAGRGRELVWFPDPIGGRDCRYGALPEPLLLHRALPEASRITARIDTGPLERALTPLVPDSLRRGEGLGAVSVEVEGALGDLAEVRLMGAVDRPGLAAGALAALVAAAAGSSGRAGAVAVGELDDPGGLLADLAERGVKTARFVGATR